MSNWRHRRVVVLLSSLFSFGLFFSYQLDTNHRRSLTEVQHDVSTGLVDVAQGSNRMSTFLSKSSGSKAMSDLRIQSLAAVLKNDQSKASFAARQSSNQALYRLLGVASDTSRSVAQPSVIETRVTETNFEVEELTTEVTKTTSPTNISPRTMSVVLESKEDEGSANNKLREQTPRKGMVADYCNLPEQLGPGDEGSAPARYSLVSVHAVLRHGARVPMNASLSLGPLKFPKVKCRLSASRSSMPAVLKDFISKTNDVSKTNTSWKFPLSSRSVYCKPADLTPVGAEQHIRIGQLLREAYASHVNVSHATLRISSTHRIRTYQSAVALSFGLLGGKVNFTQLQIEKLSNNAMCRSAKRQSCQCDVANSLWVKGQRQVAHAIRSVDPYFKDFNNSIYRSLGARYGTVPSFYPWRTAHSMMASRLCNKITLPCGEKACLKESQADANWKSLNIYHKALSSNRLLSLWAKISMYNFLGELTSSLSLHSTQPNSIQHRISVYSAHDNSLIPLLIALDLPVKQWPPFASRLIFELYKPISRNQGYLFKVISNGEDVTSDLNFCGPELKETGACSLRFFTSYYLNILAGTGYSNYNDACRN